MQMRLALTCLSISTYLLPVGLSLATFGLLWANSSRGMCARAFYAIELTQEFVFLECL